MERYIHTIEHYLAIKKEQTMNTCKNMDESQKYAKFGEKKANIKDHLHAV